LPFVFALNGRKPPGCRASGGDLDLPPAHQHPERPEAGLGVPLAAARLADLGAGDLDPLELGGAGQHRPQQLALAGLLAGALAQRGAGAGDPLGEGVAQALELTEVEDPGLAGGRGDSVLDDDPAEALGDEAGELAVEAGDLGAQLSAGGALRDRSVERRDESVSYEQLLHTPPTSLDQRPAWQKWPSLSPPDRLAVPFSGYA
jgi:hypothetical protein